MSARPPPELEFRAGRAADLRATFELGEVTLAVPGVAPDAHEIECRWDRHRELLEFIVAQEGSGYWICEDGDEPVGYARVCRFGEMEELTELVVAPSRRGAGIGRALLELCWPGLPSPDLGRVVVAGGAPADLSLYVDFGVMPTTGHWHLRAGTGEFRERRSLEIDSTDRAVHVLKADRAVSEWNRLEPRAIGHRRPLLHDFFGRTRSCLATVDEQTGDALALCWVGTDADIGPAVALTPEDLVPVVLAAIDRVARSVEPETLEVFCATDCWWLLRRLRRLGFRVRRASWVLSSVPLPGLDRYLPTRPPRVL
ncbi:MAG: GNAT family N-acetyltransferase [Thermoleophilaceae bacterium]